MKRHRYAVGAVLLMPLPNLVWVLLDRGLWVSDSCFYALVAMRVHYASIHGGVDWWEQMLATGPKPPILPWLGQLFVPVGQLLGGIEPGLLLVNFLAQAATLLLLYHALLALFGSRLHALAGCLFVASAPVFAGTKSSRRHAQTRKRNSPGSARR